MFYVLSIFSLIRGLWERRFILITKVKKNEQVAKLRDSFSRSHAVVLTEYKGLTVAEISALRKALKEAGAEYMVVKNTLIEVATNGTPAGKAKDYLKGPTGLAFGYEDPIAVAKKVLEFADKNDKFKVKSGIFDGRVYSADEVREISKLPSRNVLLSMLAGVFQAPASKLAGALNATVAQFAYALESLKQKREA